MGKLYSGLAGLMAALILLAGWAAMIPYKDSPAILVAVMLFWAVLFSAGLGMAVGAASWGISAAFGRRK